jgi:hypothetical protein
MRSAYATDTGARAMRKETVHLLRMSGTDADGNEHALDIFKDKIFTEDPEGGEIVTKGPSYMKTEDGLDVIKLADGRYKVVATGLEFQVTDPTKVKFMFRIG